MGVIIVENIEHHYYTSLFDIAASLNSSANPDEVLKRVVEKMAKALGVKGCALLLVTPDKKQLKYATSYGLSESYIKKGPLQIDKRFEEVLMGKHVVTPDTISDSRLQYPEEAKKEGITSIISLPMKLKGKIIGAVCAYCTKPARFSDDDIYFASGVANLGAIALENARRYERSQKDYAECLKEFMYWGYDHSP
jgi:GAF domain-containing protein